MTTGDLFGTTPAPEPRRGLGLGGGSAIISRGDHDEIYRYELRRPIHRAGPPLVVGMLNPSIANGQRNDPTVIRLIRRCEIGGYGELIVWNAFAGVSTDPLGLYSMVDPVGPTNDGHITRIMLECKERGGVAVVGWGAGIENVPPKFYGRDQDVLAIINNIGVPLNCWGKTALGFPRHPGRIGYDVKLEPYP